MIIDAAIHPECRNAELVSRLDEPYRGLALPELQNQRYVPSRGWLADELAADPEGAQTVETASRFVFGGGGAAAAVVAPAGRGLIASSAHAAAVAQALNRWQKERWLDAPSGAGRYLGSIRVAPGDAQRACREIETWADDPKMVQVLVPLAAHSPYGRQEYFQIWQTAVEHGLPVAVMADGQLAMEFPPTPVGYPSHFAEVATLQPMLAAMHVTSLIAEGVFDRLPELRFIFLDGGFDLARPILWRLRKDWRATRFELAAKEDPMAYIGGHVRFASSFADGPDDPAQLARFAALEASDRLVLYASHHPRWDRQRPQDVFLGCPEDRRREVLGGNALSTYGARLAAALTPSESGSGDAAADFAP